MSYGTGGSSKRKEGFGVEKCTPCIACVQKRNRITSVVAIVAPQPCDLVRGAFGADYTGASRLTYFPFWLTFFPVLRSSPLPQ